MTTERDPTSEYVQAVATALTPYAWYEHTAQMVARQVVAAIDQHSVAEFLAEFPGARLLAARQVEPADGDDSRVAVLVEMLEKYPWREFTVEELALQMLGTVAAWELDRERMDAELRELLGEL